MRWFLGRLVVPTQAYRAAAVRPVGAARPVGVAAVAAQVIAAG